MKLETLVIFIVVVMGLLVAVSVAFDSSDCRDKGGVLVKNAWGGLTCVQVSR